MNAKAIKDFSKKLSNQVSNTFGTLIIIKDEPSGYSSLPFLARVTRPRPVVNLISGGLNYDNSLTVRYPIERAEKPLIGYKIHLVEENVDYRVESATTLKGSFVDGAEVTVNATRQ